MIPFHFDSAPNLLLISTEHNEMQVNFRDVDRYVTERRQERQRTRTNPRRSRRAELKYEREQTAVSHLCFGGEPASESAGCSLKQNGGSGGKFGSRYGSCY